ncbi:MAG TPA: hypothetical protein DIT03_02540 [Candidatus Accumulibacter sp.]|nr:MAG: hypothetical protein AW07_02857 [Candidatus Accumulibacter sp. SK-11]HAY29680.1 hypothetical protein [Accumulibacter sp.]HCN67150.1 hypothetical protein [Accumulibacter sp.]
MKKPVQKVSAPEVTADVGTAEAATPEAATPEAATPKPVTAKAATPEAATSKATTTKAVTPKPVTAKAATPKPVTPKPATPKAVKAVKTVPAVPSLRILKIGHCLTVSGKSTLTYHVGCTPESAIQIRLYTNSGKGFLNQDWIPWTAIQERLKPQSGETFFTSQVLHALFRGKSLNSPGFLMAVLKAEGVVKASAVKRRCYETVENAGFLAGIERLMASTVDLDAEAKPAAKSRPKKQAAEPDATDQGTAEVDTAA